MNMNIFVDDTCTVYIYTCFYALYAQCLIHVYVIDVHMCHSITDLHFVDVHGIAIKKQV